MTQNQRVLNHLIDHGYITDLIARNYGIRRLASRIHDLRTLYGVEICQEMRRDDAGARYAYYYMPDEVRKREWLARHKQQPWNRNRWAAGAAA